MQNSSILDWAGYTMAESADPRQLWEGGGALPFTPKPTKGRYGYRSVYQWQAVELWTDHHNAGDHIDASGKGCADIAHGAALAGRWKGWPEWLAWLLDRGAKFSRLDVAVDVRSGALDLDRLAAAVSEGRVISQWDAANWQQMKGIGPGVKGGNTIYAGSPASSSRLCMYDKAAEQGLAPEDGPWVRIEFRARHEVAVALSKAIAAGGMGAGLSTIMHYARFLDHSGETLPEWQAALEGAASAPLQVQKRGGTYESMAQWLDEGVATALAALVDANGGDWGMVEALVREGRKRYGAKHRTMIEARQLQLMADGLTEGV